MTTKKLHELIELAMQGRRFTAYICEGSKVSELRILDTRVWTPEAIAADWTYEEIKEPVKVELIGAAMTVEMIGPEEDVVSFATQSMSEEQAQQLGSLKKFKVTIEEIVE